MNGKVGKNMGNFTQNPSYLLRRTVFGWYVLGGPNDTSSRLVFGILIRDLIILFRDFVRDSIKGSSWSMNH